MSRRAGLAFIIASVLYLAACGAGITPPHTVTNYSADALVWVLGDLHFGVALTDGVYGRDRLRIMVDSSNARGIDAWVLTGDLWSQNISQAMRDSLRYEIKTRLNAEVLAVQGNWDFDVSDSGSSHVYDAFAREYGESFGAYSSPNNRGRRWNAGRIGSTPVVFFTANNCRDTTAGARNYYVNNPRDGGGYAADDFDGIGDPDSPQRVDLARFVSGLNASDWLIYAQHRTTHGMANIAIRPNMEGALSNADACPVAWLDSAMASNFILCEGDEHETKLLNLYGKHYTVSATPANRGISAGRLAAWSSLALSFVYADTAYTTNGALVDSLGGYPDNQNLNQYFHGWHVFYQLAFSGSTCTVTAYLVQNVRAGEGIADRMTAVGTWALAH